MAEIRKTKIQGHFQFPGLRTLYHQAQTKDEVSKIYTVVDRHNNKKKATSNEYYVARALDELGFEYEFQMSVQGGKRIAGGHVLDFLVMTRPLPTPLWVHGEHWHTGAQAEDDQEAMAAVENFGRGRYAKQVVIWGSESSSAQMAMSTVRRKLL